MQSNHHTDYSQLLPKFALSYRLDNKGNNIYATVSKGFSAGGYNLQMFSDIFRTEQSQLGAQLMQLMQKDVVVEHTDAEYDSVNNTIAYKPEESWNYELGSRLNLFGGKVHADISAYYMQIRNQQLSVMAGRYGYGRMMVNAGKSSSAGVEVALRGSAFNDRLSWSATYGMLTQPSASIPIAWQMEPLTTIVATTCLSYQSIHSVLQLIIQYQYQKLLSFAH